MRVFASATALMLMSVSGYAQSKLDAPVSTQPTVRTEIRRGHEAAFSCGLKSGLAFNGVVNCFNEVLHDNEQKGSLSEAFQFGFLYLQPARSAR